MLIVAQPTKNKCEQTKSLAHLTYITIDSDVTSRGYITAGRTDLDLDPIPKP